MILTTYEAAEKSGLSMSHLRRLLGKNILKGRLAQITSQKTVWLVEDQSLQKYLRLKRKPGPRAKK